VSASGVEKSRGRTPTPLRAHALLLCFALGCAAPEKIDMSCMQDYEGAAVGQVPREDIERRLEALQADDLARAAEIERMFREVGCEASLRRESFAASDQPNVICRLPGRSASRIVVGAHYDKVDVGDGAADNWSGAALLPSLYRSLAGREREHSFEFIAFGAEEDGLLGSRAHVKALDAAARSAILAMVNLDTVGLGALKVEKRASDPRLVCYMLGARLLLDQPPELVNVDGVGTSDFLPFRDAGIPALSIHSIAQKTLRVLHTRRDTLAAIDRDAYYQGYRSIALLLALLDSNLASRSPAPPASE
jgi:hypothetical protein